MQSLSDQVAVITGGGQGIGRAVAEVLAARGRARRHLRRRARPGRDDRDRMRAQGHEALAFAVDVLDHGSLTAMADAVVAEWGAHRHPGRGGGHLPVQRDRRAVGDEWDRVMGINAKGALFAIQACLPSMRERGYGRVVLMSSITGPVTGQTGFAHYGASKAAMLGMMRSIAVEVATEGVTVNAVMPGNVRTEGFATIGPEHQHSMLAAIPMGRLAEPEDIGWAVRILAAPESGYITGQTLIVDGGQVLPEGAG